MRVILVGAGISSAIISLLLRRQFGPRIKLAIFDKGRNLGGRMTTSYDDEQNPHCSIDTGAQYLTQTKSNSTTTKFFQQLIDDRVIEPLNKQNTIGIRENSNKIDYTVPHGIASIVRYFFQQASVEMNLSKRITNIDYNSTKDKFTISSNQQQLDEAEAVIITIPVPQILTQLNGSIIELIDNQKDIKEKLNQVKYSTRFAVGLFYPPSVTSLNLPWHIYYVDKKDNDYLRFLAIDNVKRNLQQPPFSLIAHTSVEFGAQHVDDDKIFIGEKIKENIFQFLPELPRNISGTKYHKWKYSQIIQPYPNKPGHVVLNEQPLLVLAGDSFATESNFEACIEAAIATVNKFTELSNT